jgi:hypothetical protein
MKHTTYQEMEAPGNRRPIGSKENQQRHGRRRRPRFDLSGIFTP